MSAVNPARDKVSIVGYAHSPVVRNAAQPLGALTVDIARAAIADAGLTPQQVDGFVTAALLPTAGSHSSVDGVSIVTANWLAAHLGVTPRYAAGFQGFGQLSGAVSMAVNALSSGAADYVVVHRALHNPPRGRYHGSSMSRAAGDQQWVAPQGYFGPLAMIALPYNEYLQRFGATREAMAAVVVEARKNGSRIPWSAWYDKPLTEEAYLRETPLVDPICRLDCDLPVDGVAAFVLTTSDRARDLPHRPVHVSGIASSQPRSGRLPMHWPLDDIIDVGAETVDRLWRSSGLGPADVDLPQVYDGFSPFVWFWLEALGLCEIGEAHRFVAEGGIDSDRPGSLPALSGGGALGNGRMHGVPQMLECYLQLAGRAGDRQREGMNVAVACQSSPHLGGAVVYTAGDAT